MVGQRIQQGLVSDTERFGDFPKNVLVNFSGRLCEISGRIFWDYALKKLIIFFTLKESD